MNEIICGKEACRRTIGGWQIAMNGLMAKTNLYKNFIQSIDRSTFSGAFADEIDHRKLLLCAENIAIADAHYLYRQQSQSIVHSTSLNSYNYLKVNRSLLEWVTDIFKDEKDILQRMYDEYIEKVYRAQQRYFQYQNQYKKEDRERIKELIEVSYKYIKEHKMKFRGWKKQLLGTSLHFFKLYTWGVTFFIKILNR